MSPSHVVVDGSNIATEGRSTPSLKQLDEAIREFQVEFPGAEVIVVVDATFGHRIDASERQIFDEAVAHGELVTPPAGAIGRGDAFVLRVAERVKAQVLSNDSFQEFHADHPWLFDDGRLMGGKPVPGVGWIFTPRLPVRGPRSRAVTSTGSGRGRRGASKVAEAAVALASDEPARPVKLVRPPSAPKVGDVIRAPDGDVIKVAKATKEPAKTTKAAKATKATKVAKEPAKKAAKATKTTKAAKATKATKVAKEPAKAATKAAKATKTAKAAKEPAKAAATKTAKATKATKTTKVAKESVASLRRRAVAADSDGAPSPTETPSPPARRSRRGRGAAAAPAVAAAIEAAAEEALGLVDIDPVAPSPRRARVRNTEPAAPVAVNDPLTFLTFVTEHPLGSTVLGTVSSFVSHGAMVDVNGMLCYLPLTGLGDPPPRRAREVVAQGEERSFAVVALDPPRRGAELALPGLNSSGAAEAAEPVRARSRRPKKSTSPS
jgi:hypothetical protein